MPSTQWPRKQPQASTGHYASSWRAGEQAVRPTRVRQASLSSTALTPAERALRAIAAMNRASAPPRAARPLVAPPRAARRPTHSQNAAGPPALRRTTGIVLTAAGAILCLGVHITVAFVAIQRAGLVLLVTGLLWLWIPVPNKRNRLRRRFNQLMSYLEWDPLPTRRATCSLDDLLEPPSDSAPDGPRG